MRRSYQTLRSSSASLRRTRTACRAAAASTATREARSRRTGLRSWQLSIHLALRYRRGIIRYWSRLAPPAPKCDKARALQLTTDKYILFKSWVDEQHVVRCFSEEH